MTAAEQQHNRTGMKMSIKTEPQSSTSIQPVDFYSDTPLIQPEQSIEHVNKVRCNSNGPLVGHQTNGVKAGSEKRRDERENTFGSTFHKFGGLTPMSCMQTNNASG